MRNYFKTPVVIASPKGVAIQPLDCFVGFHPPRKDEFEFSWAMNKIRNMLWNPGKLFLLILLTLTSCGKLSLLSLITESSGDGDGDATVYFFATDFSSSGQLYHADIADSSLSAENTGITNLGSSAILRYFDGLLYLLHDGYSTGSSDNVQVIDPDDSYATLAQFSTGNGTNPHDIVVTGDTAWISVYNPDATGSGDVIKMDLESGEILQNFSFAGYLNDDGDKNANADQMVLVDDTLYVALQDLESTTFDANASGLIGVIDAHDDSIRDVITLSGRNPVDIAAGTDSERLYIAHMAQYDEDQGDFDLSTPYGGIEIIDRETGQTQLFIDDNDLGGYVERLVVSEDQVFAVVSDFDVLSFTYLSRIVRFPHDISGSTEVTTFVDFESDIRDLFAQNDYLWVSKRVMDSSSGIREAFVGVYDIVTGETLTSDLSLEIPATSIAGE